VYSAVLVLHSWLRWVVVLAGLWAVVRALTNRGEPWSPSDQRAATIFVAALDAQLLLGAALYVVLSPFTNAAFQDFGSAMGNAGLRFWAVEHLFGMLIGITLAHIGSARIRRAPLDRRRRLASIFYSLALVAILASIPWPGMPAGRPLFRW
jgi:hypothetical protein